MIGNVYVSSLHASMLKESLIHEAWNLWVSISPILSTMGRSDSNFDSFDNTRATSISTIGFDYPEKCIRIFECNEGKVVFHEDVGHNFKLRE